jgi:hypothetical protein
MELNEEIGRLLVEIQRTRRHLEMMLATTLGLLVAHVEIGNITQALETLRLMRDYYRAQADS